VLSDAGHDPQGDPGGDDLAVTGPDIAMPPPYVLPAGYSLAAFLSADAQHEFAQPDMVLEKGKDYVAVIEVGLKDGMGHDVIGRIVLDLLEVDTPITVNSFVFLALHHFFDGIAFHRVIGGFVAQTGDPLTLDPDQKTLWGTGGPGYTFGLEIVNGLSFDAAGVVGMARSAQPDTNGSQFFITLAPATNLDGKYTIFARLTEGVGVLPQLARGEPPDLPTRMTRVYIGAK
jgi:cyclophilin family peptidyl-prolyl cis-trans isomerase